MVRCIVARSITATFVAFLVFGAARAVAAPAAVATYLFNDSFDAMEPGAPALQPVDPLGLGRFDDAVVLGQSRRVYSFDGNMPVEEQAGLSLATAGLLAPDRYSVELVFEFVETNGAWRRILDVQDRGSDNGFYVSPQSLVEVYENGALADGTTPFTTSEFHHVVLTNDSSGVVSAYLDGRLEFTATSTTHVMDIANPRSALNLFLDNVVGGGQGEYADGRIALFRAYDAILSDVDVAALAANPFPAAIEVAIDVKPGSFPNAINLGSNGVVTVAILGSARFDAATIDPFTVTLASAPIRLRGSGTPAIALEDVNGDGFPDLVLQVNSEALVLSDTDTRVVLEGKTQDNVSIRGVDSVRVVP